jgi:hypothetical protein
MIVLAVLAIVGFLVALRLPQGHKLRPGDPSASG